MAVEIFYYDVRLFLYLNAGSRNDSGGGLYMECTQHQRAPL